MRKINTKIWKLTLLSLFSLVGTLSAFAKPEASAVVSSANDITLGGVERADDLKIVLKESGGRI